MVARNTPIVAPAERELVITRVFDAPRDLVFKAWTDPRQAVQWWGARDYPATHLEMDVRPGGAWRWGYASSGTSSSKIRGRSMTIYRCEA